MVWLLLKENQFTGSIDMIDLTHFLFNSISFLESTTATQETADSELPVEFSNESIDQDNSVDPSSFVLLFADILANNPDKNESKSNECAPESSIVNTNTLNSSAPLLSLQSQQNKEISTDEAKIGMQSLQQDKPIINAETIVSHEEKHIVDFEPRPEAELIIANNSINLSLEEQQLPLDVLENNVAMAWINAENFQPPQSIPFTESMDSSDSLEYDFSPELEELIVDSGESINPALKKELPIDSDPITDSVNESFLINKNDNLPKNQPVVSVAKNNPLAVKSEIKLEPKIESIVLAGSQDTTQPQQFSTGENQPLSDSSIPKSLDIPVDISDSQWAEKFSKHIVWLGQQGLKSALIKINPEDLGPLEISIKVVKDLASVSIHSQSSHVCNIVDQALPKLREMMAEQGLNLSDVYVGSDESSRQFSQNNYGSDEVITMHTEDEVQAVPLAKKARDGLIDYFA